MRKSWILYFVISGICLFGCMSPKERTEEVIKEFKKEKVVLPYEDMSCWINDSIQHNRPWEQAKLKLVIYVDSTNCSECTLKTMYMWKDFVEMEQEYKPDFFLVYIFQTKKEIAPRALASEFKITELNHPMYIDSQSVFAKSNPHLPQESLYHIFLLDNENNVILVGNPLFNPQIEELLRKEVEDRIK